MGEELFSIRMRASAGDAHLSGAERIVNREEIDRTTAELRVRAMSKRQVPDRIAITIESLRGMSIVELSALPLKTIASADFTEARLIAAVLLQDAGVSPKVVRNAIDLLDRGPSLSAGNMRGAVIMTASRGERLEPDGQRGIRVSRFDWKKTALPLVVERLASAGLTHFRTKEALALATKVASAPGVIAELCWSDDRNYLAGYVASRTLGYVRFNEMKPEGLDKGGRVIFVEERTFDLQACADYLQRQPVLIDILADGDVSADEEPYV